MDPGWVRLLGRSQLSNPSDLPCFKVKHYFGHISGMVCRLMWNEKEVHQLDTGYNMWPWPLTSLMNSTLDVSMSNFEIPVSQEFLYDWGEMKRKRSPLTTPMALTLEFQGQSDMDKNDVSRPFMTIISTSETMVGWVDIPDSDRGYVAICDRRNLWRCRNLGLKVSQFVTGVAICDGKCRNLWQRQNIQFNGIYSINFDEYVVLSSYIY